jgi:putative DNA primase/helicase
MIETAIKYGKLGLKVFPVKHKVPAVKGWQKSASCNEEDIRKMFKCPHTGIGMACGEMSGITVIDVDNKNGVNGFRTLENLGINLPPTVCVNTPSGGKQYYFKYNPAIKNMVSAFHKGSGIDIRNDGGLVIMPKSVHPNGGIYEFELEQEIGECELENFPAEIESLLVEKKQKDYKNFELPTKINDGERNNTLFKYASQLRATGLNKEEILPALYVVNTERCNPPYDKDKLEIIADSVCTYPKGKRPIPADEVVYSDTYNAKVFHEIMGNKIRWCKDYGGWFIFNGKYWEKDSNERIKKYAMQAAEEIAERMRLVGNKGRPNLNKVHTEQGINAMISCSKALLGCSVDEFDRNEYLFNCSNGTYDLSRNIFLDFDVNDLITKKANVEYDIHAECPRWLKFLDEIFLGDIELIKYIQRVIGYSMTSFTREHCMFILYGHGRNGKNIFTEAISGVLGDYALNCPSSMFVQKQNPGIPNDVARLKGARFVSASETNHNVNMDEELIKQLTGNKIITARFLNKEYFDFEATFKIFLATNHKPNIRGTDTGIWSRIHMIPFNLTITPEMEDKTLSQKLANETSGIFNWMIEGYNEWVKHGLNVPDVIKQATQLYREEEDDLGQFIKMECVVDKSGFIPSQEFRERFKLIMGYPKGTKALGEYMARKGYKPSDDTRIYIHGRQLRGFTGIRWATEADRTEDKGWS